MHRFVKCILLHKLVTQCVMVNIGECRLKVTCGFNLQICTFAVKLILENSMMLQRNV